MEPSNDEKAKARRDAAIIRAVMAAGVALPFLLYFVLSRK